ncbi:MAG: CAP domain-containing protein [Gaiellaceae bacterium]
MTVDDARADTGRVGVDDRDWYDRSPGRERRSRPGWGVVIVLVGVLLAVVGIQGRLHTNAPDTGGERQSRAGDTKLRLLPGLPALTIHKGSLYPAHDEWESYLADEQTCPGGERTDLPLEQQASIMKCLIDYARGRLDLAQLAPSALLSRTSLEKASRIVRCQEFSHSACGDEPSAEVRATGYHGDWGENLYIGEGALGSPRVALDGWLNSPGHRENLFLPDWRTQGLAVMKISHFLDFSDATLWVNQFGTN